METNIIDNGETLVGNVFSHLLDATEQAANNWIDREILGTETGDPGSGSTQQNNVSTLPPAPINWWLVGGAVVAILLVVYMVKK